MFADDTSQRIARLTLAKVSPGYAQKRFNQISEAWVKDWSNNPAPYRAIIEALPTGEREKVSLLFAITVEQLIASDTRRAEIDETGNELVKELTDLHSNYFMDFLNVFAPVGSSLRHEWEMCVDYCTKVGYGNV
jgi:hypothetical protein